jgi:hypothetical protein
LFSDHHSWRACCAVRDGWGEACGWLWPNGLRRYGTSSRRPRGAADSPTRLAVIWSYAAGGGGKGKGVWPPSFVHGMRPIDSGGRRTTERGGSLCGGNATTRGVRKGGGARGEARGRGVASVMNGFEASGASEMRSENANGECHNRHVPGGGARALLLRVAGVRV